MCSSSKLQGPVRVQNAAAVTQPFLRDRIVYSSWVQKSPDGSIAGLRPHLAEPLLAWTGNVV
jgi:hypothetical protein